jgi:hypothetical protein
MRYRDLNLTEAELMEINMSPGNLKRLTANIEALAGMEFEMCVPNAAGADEDYEPEPDYDSDERARSIDDVCEFFHDGDHNSRRTIEDLRRRLQRDFEEWSDEQLMDDWSEQGMDAIYEYVKNNVDDDTIIEELGLEPDAEGNPPMVSRKEWAQYAERAMEEHSDIYDSAYEEFRDDWYNDSDKEETWLEHEGMEMMSDVESSYHITWPHWHYDGQNANGVDVEFVADDFRQAIGRKVNWSRNYHSGKREPGAYVVEPDGSIDTDDTADGGLEFVSPPLPLSELLSDLAKVKEWANRTGCYTNNSTGLHINVSVPGFDINNLDYVKLALLLGDEHILEVFGRMGNSYCKSAVEVVKKRVKNNPDAAEDLLNQMRGHLGQMASKAIHTGVTDKYTSINTKSGYIEFRSPGGDWLNKLSEGEEIQHTLLRFVVALDAALKPDLYREEYLKKLYKVLDVKSEKDPLWYFVKYSAGGFSPTVLKSFVRQAQLERDVKRGKDKGPMWWRVYKEGKNAANGAVIEVVASGKEEALDKASQEWGVFSSEYRRAMYAEPLRPYVEEKGPELNGRPSNPDGNYVIVNASTSEPAYRYMASDMTDATLVLRQWITANPGTQWDFKRDPEMRLGQPGSQGVDTSRQYELYDRRSGAVVATFQASDDDAALQKLDQFRAGQVRTQGITVPQANEIYGVRSSGIVRVPPRDRPSSEPIPGSTLDLQRQRAAGAEQEYLVDFDLDDGQTGIERMRAPNASAAMARVRADLEKEGFEVVRINAELVPNQAPMADVEPDLSPLTSEPPPQLPGMGQWNGQWKVLVGGEEVYRFGGVGNSQADANRIAAAWLRQNGQGVSGEGFEVYPVMD